MSNGDYDTKVSEDRSKRFDYLLEQTEIFAHFMTSGQKSGEQKAKPGRKPKVDPNAKPNLTDINDHRHRKTEQEEDEELLSQSKKAETYFRYVIDFQNRIVSTLFSFPIVGSRKVPSTSLEVSLETIKSVV